MFLTLACPCHVPWIDCESSLQVPSHAASGWSVPPTLAGHISTRYACSGRRGQEPGSALLELTGETVIERACTHAFLETFDFQALPFYRQHGYAIFSELKGFPPGGSWFSPAKVPRLADRIQP
ncbi:hypothetical protein [Dyella sp. RRB7]|uniref:hypothetical protein n=1 Tax=Dyella sp. RRB7 TaxID=2919502 RepID=UPI001FAB35C9|nr:hypothetical protein [Dyella sp. RRB7]